ncbi:lysozyme inhibitor LprI family protein [Pseudoxanthomonas suwonensis]|uniref:lysozyme inhibitor LprI family protein n=1 Tax=Pseudoxanthomonas suwonensis TaxID=314722 RepID=UPI000696C4F2|nr:lysozyme inhibitor LprI family protein [Pseudoxanthomonas suwonensis]
MTLRPWRPLALLLMLHAAPATSQPAPVHFPAFDCARAASPVEKTICGDADLAAADRRMAVLYEALLAKQADRTDRTALRREQRRWLRDVRNRCADYDCLVAAYQTRNAELHRRNRTPRQLPPWPTAPLIERPIARIDDTRAERRLDLRSAVPRRLQLELHVDPDDHLDWTLPGPRVLLECTDPGHRDGYAPDFRHQAMAYGVEFTPVWRALAAAGEESTDPAVAERTSPQRAYGFILLELELGRDLPLDQDIRCMAVFTEWLLERPSTLYLVDAAGR